MKKIFIYYSLTGNGDEVAKYMTTFGYETYKIETKHKFPKKFFFRMMQGGFEAGINKKKRIKEFTIDPSKYDLIVVGSPVWNDRVSSPINTVINKLKDYKGKIKFIFYAGGRSAKHATIKVSKSFLDARSIVIQEPKKHPDEYLKLDEFVR